MAITKISSLETANTGGPSSPWTISVNIGSRTNGLLVVSVAGYLSGGGFDTITMTYAGTNVPRATHVNGTYYSGIYALANPTNGTNDLVITFNPLSGGTWFDAYVLVSWYDGARQTNVLDQVNQGTGSTDPSLVITPQQDGELIVSSYISDQGTVLTPGETLLDDYDHGVQVTGGSYTIQTAAAQQTIDFSGTDASWSMSIASFRPATTGLTRSTIGAYNSGTAHGTGSFSTGSFTPLPNSLLLVFVVRTSSASILLPGLDVSGGSLSYNLVGQTRNGNSWSGSMIVYSAVTGGSPGSMTVTVDDADNNSILGYSVFIVAYENFDTGDPIDGFNANGDNVSTLDGSETIVLTETPATGDATLLGIWHDTEEFPEDPDYATGWVEICETIVTNGYMSLYVAERRSSTSTSVTIDDVYTKAPSYYKSQMLGFIVRESTAGGEPLGINIDPANYGGAGWKQGVQLY